MRCLHGNTIFNFIQTIIAKLYKGFGGSVDFPRENVCRLKKRENLLLYPQPSQCVRSWKQTYMDMTNMVDLSDSDLSRAFVRFQPPLGMRPHIFSSAIWHLIWCRSPRELRRSFSKCQRPQKGIKRRTRFAYRMRISAFEFCNISKRDRTLGNRSKIVAKSPTIMNISKESSHVSHLVYICKSQHHKYTLASHLRWWRSLRWGRYGGPGAAPSSTPRPWRPPGAGTVRKWGTWPPSWAVNSDDGGCSVLGYIALRPHLEAAGQWSPTWYGSNGCMIVIYVCMRKVCTGKFQYCFLFFF